jgi:hypothetical protein
MNIGEIIEFNSAKPNAFKAIILDVKDDAAFVLAYDLGVKSRFDEYSSNYANSILRKTVEDSFDRLDIEAIPRKLDLTTMNGYKDYESIEVKAAPLTFSEYRRYNPVIPSIASYFWLATAHGLDDADCGFIAPVCAVNGNNDGYISKEYIGRHIDVVYAFWTPINQKKETPEAIVTCIPTPILLSELSRRLMNH